MDVLFLVFPVNATLPTLLTAALFLLALASRMPRLATGLAVALISWFLGTAMAPGVPASEGTLVLLEHLIPTVLLTLGTLWVVWRGRDSAPPFAGVGWMLAILWLWLGVVWMADPAWRDASAPGPWFLAGVGVLEQFMPSWYARFALPGAVLAALWWLPGLEARAASEGGAPHREVGAVVLLLWTTLGLVPLWAAALGLDARAAGEPLSWPLSVQVWERWTTFGLPASSWIRELPGLLIYALYFVFVPHQLPRRASTRGVFARYRERLGRARYFAAAILLLWLLLPILKVYALWLFGVETIVHWAEGGIAL